MSSKSKKSRKNRDRSRRKQRSTIANCVEKKYPAVHLLSYEITDEPFADPTIPEEVKDEMEYLYEESQKPSGIVIERLEELIKIYPKVPIFYNFISVAYSVLGERKKSKYYIEKNYKNNPHYLFAKLNYAELCIREGDYKKIPEILENKFDIKALYPERNVFHISEVVGFLGTVGLYFYYINNIKLAEIIYEGLKKLAPEHQNTKRLKRSLAINTVTKGFKRLFGTKKKKEEEFDYL